MEVASYACEGIRSYIQTSQPLSLVGLLAVVLGSTIICKVVIWTPFKLYFLAQVLPGIDLTKLGKWAVITGATDGIEFLSGKQYAKAMARRGLDVVLISLPKDLAEVAKELKLEYNVKVIYIDVDFAKTNNVYERIEEGLRGLDVAVLINNVGKGSAVTTFLKTENLMSSTLDMVHINCVPMSLLCAIVLPHMLKKNKGVVINVSSIASDGFVGGTIYSATKAYVSRFSDCLQRTYKKSGVIIQTVEPGMVLTNMLEISLIEFRNKGRDPPRMLVWGKAFASVTPQDFVRCSLNTLGWSDHTNGHFLHYLTSLLNQLQPQAFADEGLLADLED